MIEIQRGDVAIFKQIMERKGSMFHRLAAKLVVAVALLVAGAALEVYSPFHASATSGKLPGNLTVPEVIKKVSPAVVAIIGKPSDVDEWREDRFALAHGTGVIVKSDGLIVTNAHVVKDLKQIVVVTHSGKQYDGKATHIDEESDLALVKISAKGLPVASFGDASKVQAGETVVAVGTPISFSLRNSVTTGVISGVDRSIHSTYRLFQTDAAINPGNSGGPLVNLKGEVIGINSLKFGGAFVDNLGFSIPSDTVKYVMDHFQKYGKVNRPYLGADLEESWTALVGLPTQEPLVITRIDEGSPAAKAGLKVGDKIYSVDQKNVHTLVEFNELMKNYLPGKKATFMIESDGDLLTKVVTFGAVK